MLRAWFVPCWRRGDFAYIEIVFEEGGAMVIDGAEPFFFAGSSTGVLLLHGFTGLPAELLLLGRHLSAAGFSVLAPRLAGHGTRPEDMARTCAEDWLDSARDGYALLSGACERIFVCGHSMGALLALLVVAERGAAGVVSLSAPVFVAEEQGVAHLPPRALCEGLFVPKARRRLRDVPPAANETYRKMPLVCVHELLALIECARAALPRVEAPALILHGTADRTADPASAIYLEKYIGSASRRLLWLEGAGHLVVLGKEREAVFAETAAFLRAHGG